MKYIVTLLILVFNCSAQELNFNQDNFTSKKKTPMKKSEEAIKTTSGELTGKIKKDKQDFKKYVLEARDKKTWAIGDSSLIKKYYNRTVKLKAHYYSKDGKNVIVKIDSVK